MIQNLTAVQFTRFMTSGRTSPVLCGCEDQSAAPAGDYVVKLRGALQSAGLVNEIIGAKLAAHFGLPSPTPALIMLEQKLADLIAGIEPSKADLISQSVGLNFGTEAATGFMTWPVDKRVPEVLMQTAVNIFAFDALVQNPDRRHSNPNLLSKGDSLLIFDHEIAFSFLLEIFPSPTPWRLDRQQYLSNHVFYQQLRAQEIDLSAFTGHLSQLTEAAFEEILADIPVEWNNVNGLRIGNHLFAVRDHAEEFAEEVRRFLI
jgi:hypothetical protein